MEKTYTHLISGIQRFFKDKAPKACLGLSGGLDSALVLALVRAALGPAADIKVLLMPSQYSSPHSVDDALEMVDKLGIAYQIIHIEGLHAQFIRALAPLFADQEEDVTEENLQARIRGVLLMALSNKCGYYLMNTSNKSELAVGYGTLYGDLCGSLSVIGDLYKTQAFDLARYINRNEEIIPNNIITKPPSAELRPNHFDTDSLPDYAVLDAILHLLIDEQKSITDILALGYDEALLAKIIKLRQLSSFKAYQVPPIIKLSTWSVLPDWKCF